MANRRTRLEFTTTNPIEGALAAWAQGQGFKLKTYSQDRWVYGKGGFWTAPMLVEITKSGSQIVVEAYVRVQTLVYIMMPIMLLILPREMPAEAGGFRMVVPRQMLRKSLNLLLPQIGQPLLP